MTQFERAIRTDFEPSRGHPQFDVWLNYALTANARGEALLGSLGSELPALRGRRHLDVGAGYGGACVAAAARGATSLGIEVDARLLGFAAANRADHPGLSLEFRRLDALDRAAIEGLGSFDLVTCDNVIEHVRSPERLVAHFAQLLAPGGLLFVTIPNAFSLGQIRSDCHYGQFGISLLDPLDGSAFVREVLGNPTYDVSDYHPFESYVAMFERHGLRAALLRPPEPADAEALLADGRALLASEAAAVVPASLRARVRRRLEGHVLRLEDEVARWRGARGAVRESVARRLALEFREEVWSVVVRHEAEDVVGRALGVAGRAARRVERRVRRAVRS